MKRQRYRSIIWSVGAWAVLSFSAEAAPDIVAIFRAPAETTTWPAAIDHLAEGAVIFIGEQHNDPATHRMELATLKTLSERGDRPVVLSMEMFETDVQTVLDDYLAGRIDEAGFLARSRPWPNYAADYKPLVEYAKAHGIRVIAANAPRPLAAKVAKEGLGILQQLDWALQRQVAVPTQLDHGAPWARFSAIMGGHQTTAPDSTWRMYEAQSLKDATMARSIGLALATIVPGGRVLHVQGRFHSDYHAGVPAFLTRLVPERTQRVMTVVPVAGVAEATMADMADLADIVAFVTAMPGAPD